MRRLLPPINSLRAFEAAARHLSFKDAAEELNVTPAAISQQIKLLEDTLGRKLFRRLTRKLILTEQAKLALPCLSEGFDQLAKGYAALSSNSDKGRLVVSVPNVFGARWLLPRLPSFYAKCPGIDVRLDASDKIIKFSDMDVDVAIRFAAEAHPDFFVEPLISVRIFPVCSPDLVKGPNALKTPEDLAHHTLLHYAPNHDVGEVTHTSYSWDTLLEAAHISHIEMKQGTYFNLFNMIEEAAVTGHGIGLTNNLISADALNSGQLINPLASYDAFENKATYNIVCPKSYLEDPAVVQFCDWLIGEAKLFNEKFK